MHATSPPRAVVVTRPTELEHLVARHGTRAQARFALNAAGRAIDEIEAARQAETPTEPVSLDIVRFLPRGS